MSPSAFEPWHAAGPGPQQTSEWAKLPSVVTWANTLVKGTNTVVIERTTDISVNGERTREEESERQGLAHLHPLSRNREEESVSQGRDDATTLDQAMSRGEEDNMLADLETAATTIQRRVRRFMPREKVKNHAEGSISDGSAKAEMISVDLRLELSMHLDETGNEGSQLRETFTDCLLSDVAIAAGVDCKRLSILSLSTIDTSRIKVVMRILPEGGTTLPKGAESAGLSAQSAAMGLIAMADDKDSPLLEGILTRYTLSLCEESDQRASAADVSFGVSSNPPEMSALLVSNAGQANDIVASGGSNMHNQANAIVASGVVMHNQAKDIVVIGGGDMHNKANTAAAATKIQVLVRGLLARKKLMREREQWRLQEAGVIKMQGLVRGRLTRKHLEKEKSNRRAACRSAADEQDEGEGQTVARIPEVAQLGCVGDSMVDDNRPRMENIDDLGGEDAGAEGGEEEGCSLNDSSFGEANESVADLIAALESANKNMKDSVISYPKDKQEDCGGNDLLSGLSELSQPGSPKVAEPEENLQKADKKDLEDAAVQIGGQEHAQVDYGEREAQLQVLVNTACNAVDRAAGLLLSNLDCVGSVQQGRGLREAVDAALIALSRLSVPEGRNAWARKVLASHCHYCAAVSFLATAHRRTLAEDDDGEERGNRDEDVWYGEKQWSLLYKWYAKSEDDSDVRILVYSLSPSLLFTWWSLSTTNKAPTALGHLEALLIAVYDLQLQQRPSGCVSMIHHIPSRQVVERFVTASSAAGNIRQRERYHGSSNGHDWESMEKGASSAPGKQTPASVWPTSVSKHKFGQWQGCGSPILNHLACQQVHTDGQRCPVSVFWLDRFGEHLDQMPLSARMLFVDMCIIVLGSGYRSVVMRRDILRGENKDTSEQGTRKKGKMDAAEEYAADEKTTTTAASIMGGTVHPKHTQKWMIPIVKELAGWGGDWSALRCRLGKNTQRQQRADRFGLLGACGSSCVGICEGGLVRLCPLASLELCNCGPHLESSERTAPGRYSNNLVFMRLGRRLRISTNVCLHMSVVLRRLMGHTRLELLARSFGQDCNEGGGGQAPTSIEGRACAAGNTGCENRARGKDDETESENTCSWHHECLEQEARVSLRLMEARAEADLNEQVLLTVRATLDSVTRAAKLWQATVARPLEHAAHVPPPTPLQVYFGM